MIRREDIEVRPVEYPFGTLRVARLMIKSLQIDGADAEEYARQRIWLHLYGELKREIQAAKRDSMLSANDRDRERVLIAFKKLEDMLK